MCSCGFRRSRRSMIELYSIAHTDVRTLLVSASGNKLTPKHNIVFAQSFKLVKIRVQRIPVHCTKPHSSRNDTGHRAIEQNRSHRDSKEPGVPDFEARDTRYSGEFPATLFQQCLELRDSAFVAVGQGQHLQAALASISP